jgi:hypothetical protein
MSAGLRAGRTARAADLRAVAAPALALTQESSSSSARAALLRRLAPFDPRCPPPARDLALALDQVRLAGRLPSLLATALGALCGVQERGGPASLAGRASAPLARPLCRVARTSEAS